MNKATRTLIDTKTPFTVLEIGDIELRQYWTKNAGMYGYQVVTVIFNYPNDVWTYKTNGCGFCKPSQGFMMAWQELGFKPSKQRDNDKLNRDYFIGGNFYKVNDDEYLTKNHNGKMISVAALKEHGLSFND